MSTTLNSLTRRILQSAKDRTIWTCPACQPTATLYKATDYETGIRLDHGQDCPDPTRVTVTITTERSQA